MVQKQLAPEGQRKQAEEFFFMLSDMAHRHTLTSFDLALQDRVAKTLDAFESSRLDMRAATLMLVKLVGNGLSEADFARLAKAAPLEFMGDLMRAKFGVNDCVVFSGGKKMTLSQAIQGIKNLGDSADREKAFEEIVEQVAEAFRVKPNNTTTNDFGVAYAMVTSPREVLAKNGGNCIGLNLALGLMVESMAKEAEVGGVEIGYRRVITLAKKEERHAIVQIRIGSETHFFDETNTDRGRLEMRTETDVVKLTGKYSLGYTLHSEVVPQETMMFFNEAQEAASHNRAGAGSIAAMRASAESLLPVVFSFSDKNSLKTIFPEAKDLRTITEPSARFECALIYASVFQDFEAARVVHEALEEIKENRVYQAMISPHHAHVANLVEFLCNQKENPEALNILAYFTQIVGVVAIFNSFEEESLKNIGAAYSKALRVMGDIQDRLQRRSILNMAKGGYTLAQRLEREGNSGLARDIAEATDRILVKARMITGDSGDGTASGKWAGLSNLYKNALLTPMIAVEKGETASDYAKGYSDYVNTIRENAMMLGKTGEPELYSAMSEKRWYADYYGKRYEEFFDEVVTLAMARRE